MFNHCYLGINVSELDTYVKSLREQLETVELLGIY